MEDRLPRKLAAILYTDVAGYSRLTGEDEDGTHRRLSEYLDLISTTIESHGGQVMHYAGDAVLAKFEAVVDTMSAAIEIQQSLRSRNQELPEERRVEFRIGVNSGDVIEDRGDIYGDGVNVAARLESLADAGGICISDAVRTAVGKKLDLDYEDMGEQEVKNIAEPVRAYRVAMGAKEASGKPAQPSLEFPDKPSIAVLPFTNMSGDPEQEFFSDGITEDIITELSRFSILFVIARHSSFAFKGEKVDIKEVGQKLGVQYVVEGSVRKAGNRVRISAQLIEAETGNHVWAERYDRELKDIFAVQDEVTQSIVAVLPGHVERAIAERAARKPTDNMKAYEYLLQGNIHFHRLGPDENRKARQFYQRAIELDPRFAQAYARLGDTHNIDSFQGWGTEDSPSLALSNAETAVELDPEDGFARQVLLFAYLKRGLWEEAEEQLDIALRLNPNDAENLMWAGEASMILGRHPEAVALLEQAMRLDPIHPNFYWGLFGQVLYCLRDYERTVRTLRRGSITDAWDHVYLAAAYGQLGERAKAEDELARFHDRRREELESSGIAPAESVFELVQHKSTYYSQREDWEHLLEGLRKAGLPE